MLKAKKLSHLIEELKQNSRKDQIKTAKKGETPAKDKSLAILMVQSWQRIARKRITQNLSPESVKTGFWKIRAIPSTAHGYAKIPNSGEIVTLRAAGLSTECSMVQKKGCRQTCSTLTEEGRKEICGLLRRHLDVFAWKPSDMTGVSRNIGRNLEVYVDDLVIKSRTEKEVIRDIEETFRTLREINMKLYPKKYAFGMREDIFLGYKVDADRLRVCPEKVEVVLNLPSPRCLKDVQKLNGKLASLNRPRKSVKGQILADFIVERPEDDVSDTPMEEREELPDPWVLFTNGSSCIDGSGAGLIITNTEGMEFTHALRFRFNATNNEAEYEALIAGLRIARQGSTNLQAKVDSNS
ncbi:reverse transcriptase domain-containing protein [Tanacetum coccineum]